MADINSYFCGKPKAKVRTPSCPAKRKLDQLYNDDEAEALALLGSTSEEDLYEESDYDFLWDVPEAEETPELSVREIIKERERIELKKRLQKESKHKKDTIKRWKKAGMKFNNDEEDYYKIYMETLECFSCGNCFINRRNRQLDHCHHCGIPRGIICFKCNINDLVYCLFCPMDTFMKSIKKLNESSKC